MRDKSPSTLTFHLGTKHFHPSSCVLCLNLFISNASIGARHLAEQRSRPFQSPHQVTIYLFHSSLCPACDPVLSRSGYFNSRLTTERRDNGGEYILFICVILKMRFKAHYSVFCSCLPFGPISLPTTHAANSTVILRLRFTGIFIKTYASHYKNLKICREIRPMLFVVQQFIVCVHCRKTRRPFRFQQPEKPADTKADTRFKGKAVLKEK